MHACWQQDLRFTYLAFVWKGHHAGRVTTFELFVDPKYEFAFIQRPDHARSMQDMSDWVDPLPIKQGKQESD